MSFARVRVLESYYASDEKELDLEIGSTVVVTDDLEIDGITWFEGFYELEPQRKGRFPGANVELLDDDDSIERLAEDERLKDVLAEELRQIEELRAQEEAEELELLKLEEELAMLEQEEELLGSNSEAQETEQAQNSQDTSPTPVFRRLTAADIQANETLVSNVPKKRSKGSKRLSLSKSSQARIAKLSRTLPSSNEDLSHEQMRKKRSVSTLPDHEDNLERASTPPKKAPFPRKRSSTRDVGELKRRESDVVPIFKSFPTPDAMDERQKVAMEILTSEQQYVETLETITTLYGNKIKERFVKCPLSGMETAALEYMFSAVDRVLTVNKRLLRKLREKLANWGPKSTVGDAFNDVAADMSMYFDYGTYYQFSIEDLSKYQHEHPEFDQVVQACDKESTLTPRLDSLLIAPIQRMPRYILLLQDLKKKTETLHADQHHLAIALAKFKEIGDLLNNSVEMAQEGKAAIHPKDRGALRRIYHESSILYTCITTHDDLRQRKRVILFEDRVIVLLCSQPLPKSKKERASKKEEVTWSLVCQVPLHLLWFHEDNAMSSINTPFGLWSVVTMFTRENLCLRMKTAARRHFQKIAESDGEALQEERSYAMSIDSEMRYGTIYFSNSKVYKGEWKNGQMSGNGELRHGGSVYVGEFKQGMREGKGTVDYGVQAWFYEGDFKNDQPNGSGSMKFGDGRWYVGAVKNGEREGEGKMIWANGDTYTGSWSHGLPSGTGYFVAANGSSYSGMYKDGMRNGYGVFKMANGAKYTGFFLNDMMDKTGRLDLSEHQFYEGGFKLGQYEGKGELVTPYGRYEGEFSRGLMHGAGSYQYASGIRYVGQWKNGLRHGKGTMEYPEGGPVCSYVGDWHMGLKHGTGIQMFGCQQSYTGDWKGGMINGEGTYSQGREGWALTGRFKDCRPVGRCKIVKNGEQHEGVWTEGRVYGNNGEFLCEFPFEPVMELGMM